MSPHPVLLAQRSISRGQRAKATETQASAGRRDPPGTRPRRACGPTGRRQPEEGTGWAAPGGAGTPPGTDPQCPPTHPPRNLLAHSRVLRETWETGSPFQRHPEKMPCDDRGYSHRHPVATRTAQPRGGPDPRRWSGCRLQQPCWRGAAARHTTATYRTAPVPLLPGAVLWSVCCPTSHQPPHAPLPGGTGASRGLRDLLRPGNPVPPAATCTTRADPHVGVPKA